MVKKGNVEMRVWVWVWLELGILERDDICQEKAKEKVQKGIL